MTSDEIFAEAMKLSPRERLALSIKLLESIKPFVSDEKPVPWPENYFESTFGSLAGEPLVPIPEDLLNRAKELVAGMDVDLDAPLLDEDE